MQDNWEAARGEAVRFVWGDPEGADDVKGWMDDDGGGDRNFGFVYLLMVTMLETNHALPVWSRSQLLKGEEREEEQSTLRGRM